MQNLNSQLLKKVTSKKSYTKIESFFFYIVSLLLMGATLFLFCFLAAQLDKLILI